MNNKKEIEALAKKLWLEQDVVIELANILFGIREVLYDEPKYEYPLYVRDTTTGEIRKYLSKKECIIIWSEVEEYIGNNIDGAFPHTHPKFEQIAFDDKRQIWDKAIVRCWDDEDDDLAFEIINVYDAINKCSFFINGTRNGCKFDNYEIVDNPSDRMLELQKTLK